MCVCVCVHVYPNVFLILSPQVESLVLPSLHPMSLPPFPSSSLLCLSKGLPLLAKQPLNLSRRLT